MVSSVTARFVIWQYDSVVSTTDDALEDRIGKLLGAGEHAAAATVALRGYGPQILGYLQAVLRSSEDGTEAFSLFCENLWIGIPAYQHRNSFKAWAYAIAWHAALRVVQDPQRKRARPLETAQAEQLANEVRSLTAPHLVTANKDRLAELRQALDPAEQTLLILRLDRGLSWAEVAEVLAADGEDVSEANLRKRFERIKDRLRELAVSSGLLPRE
jgi:RNA polymerase sigma-70 factor, ECF subfamily